MGIPANNYYNPFGVDLPVVRRRFVEIDNRGFEEDVNMWRALGGLRGSLQSWHWETYAGYSESRATTRENGLVSLARLLPAIGPSGLDAAGQVVCGVRRAQTVSSPPRTSCRAAYRWTCFMVPAASRRIKWRICRSRCAIAVPTRSFS